MAAAPISRSEPLRPYPRRGDVHWVKLDKRRPAIVISTDSLNRYALDVCIVPLTSVGRRKFSLRVLIRAREAGLQTDSWAKCDQVTTVEKDLLVYPALGALNAATLRQVEQGIKAALELGPEMPQGF
jgi:mRNA interferase MazF